MFQTLLESLVPNDPFQAEVAIFGARSIMDALIDEKPTELIVKFLDTVFTYIEQQEIARTNFVLAKGCCGFLHEAAK
jgi:hypothetical protein